MKIPVIKPGNSNIGGTGLRRTLRLVATHADAWHAIFPERPEELEPAVRALEAHCAEVGRDPAQIEWGVGIEPDDIDRFLRQDAETYVQMGFTQFTLGFNGPAWSVERGAAFLAWRDGRDGPPAARQRSLVTSGSGC